MGTFNKGKVVLYSLIILSAITLLVSTGTQYWSQSKVSRVVHQGLWKGCIKNGQQVKCYETPDHFTQDWKRAVRAMIVIANSMYLLIFIYVIVMHVKKLNSIPIAILLGLVFIFSIIGLAVYTERSGVRRVSGLEFGFSFFCGWCACILSLITAIVAAIDSAYSRRHQPYQTRYNGNAALLRA